VAVEVPSAENLIAVPRDAVGVWQIAELRSCSPREWEAAQDYVAKIGVRLRSFGRSLGLKVTVQQINTRNRDYDLLNSRWELRVQWE
jgi:hypothetical protein